MYAFPFSTSVRFIYKSNDLCKSASPISVNEARKLIRKKMVLSQICHCISLSNGLFLIFPRWQLGRPKATHARKLNSQLMFFKNQNASLLAVVNSDNNTNTRQIIVVTFIFTLFCNTTHLHIYVHLNIYVYKRCLPN